MRLHFRPAPSNATVPVLCNADIYFNADTPLASMRLTGFTIWAGKHGAYVTFPAKPDALKPGQKSKYFEFLRGADVADSDEARGACDAVKAWILEEWKAQGSPGQR